MRIPVDRDPQLTIPGVAVFGICAVELPFVVTSTVAVLLARPLGGVEPLAVEFVLPDQHPLLFEAADAVALPRAGGLIEVAGHLLAGSLDGPPQRPASAPHWPIFSRVDNRHRFQS